MTATNEVVYTLDNTWEKARRRLTLLEEVFDPATTARLTDLGVTVGWRCLELGAGGGSITHWLCDRVGPAGSVTAVDLEPRFLRADPRPNLIVERRDIVADGVPGDGYDLIHCRALLMHLPNADDLVVDLVGRLRPRGAILLEEGDLSSTAAAASVRYADMWERCTAAAAKVGGNFHWGRQLPGRLAAAGVADMAATSETRVWPGGSAWCELTALTWEQMTPLLVADGCPSELVAAATAELFEPDRWFPAGAMVAAWGHRPG